MHMYMTVVYVPPLPHRSRHCYSAAGACTQAPSGALAGYPVGAWPERGPDRGKESGGAGITRTCLALPCLLLSACCVVGWQRGVLPETQRVCLLVYALHIGRIAVHA